MKSKRQWLADKFIEQPPNNMDNFIKSILMTHGVITVDRSFVPVTVDDFIFALMAWVEFNKQKGTNS